MTEGNFRYGSKLLKKFFFPKETLQIETDPYGTTEAGKLKTKTRRTKSGKKPIQNGFKVSMGAVNTKNKAIYLTWDQTIFFAFARFSKRPYNTK